MNTKQPAIATTTLSSDALDAVTGGCGGCNKHTTVINNYGSRGWGPPPWARRRGGGSITTSVQMSGGWG